MRLSSTLVSLPVVLWLVHTMSLECGTTTTVEALSSSSSSSSSSTVSSPQLRGCAATPARKTKVAVLGSGGYLGAITFGFLQRAASIYGTGIGSCRTLGATPDTAIRLNQILSRNFCLAQADESFIKLLDLSSVDSIQEKLQGWDALIFGTDLFLQRRPVRLGTYERTPNDKTWEVYWDEPKGAYKDFALSSEATEAKDRLLQNLLTGAKLANVQHIVVVDDGSFLPQLESSGVCYTCIQTPRQLIDTPNYTFKDGIAHDMVISSLSWGEDRSMTMMETTAKGNSATSTICREDLAALCVQSLLSLSWTSSRVLSVSGNGPLPPKTMDDVRSSSRPEKRVDQQWCVNSILLEEKLSQLN